MQPTVLLVDDEPHVTAALRRALHGLPYKILACHSGQEALDLWASKRVDLVIADEKMPGMSGTELLARVRQEHPNVCRIVLTGYASIEAAKRAVNEGAVHRFFTKPSSVEELGTAIRETLEQQEFMVNAQTVVQILRSELREMSKPEEA